MSTRSLLHRKVQVGFGIASVALLLVAGFSYRGVNVSREGDRWVRHTHEVIENLQDLLLRVESITSTYQGFVLTDKDTYVDAYRNSKLNAEQGLATVRNLTLDNPKQQRLLPLLEGLAARQIQLAETAISLRRTKSFEAALDFIRPGQDKEITEQFRVLVAEMQDEEQRLLALRDVDLNRRLRQTRTILVFGTVFGFLITGAAGWSVHRESSQRAIAEEALKNSEEQYRLLVQGIPGYAIVMLAPDGKIVSWNPGAEQMTGSTPEHAIGRNFSSFFSPSDIDKGRPTEILRIAATSGVYEEQGRRVRKNGLAFTAESTYMALRGPAGNLRGFSVVSRDLSERAESEAKYLGLLEAAPDAMVVVDSQGEIVLLNVQAEQRFGYHRDELVGKKVKNIIPEGFAERLIADGTRSAADALAQQIGTGIELTGRRKDGSDFPIEIMLSPLDSAEGILVTAAIRDISVRKNAERHLGQMEARYRGLLEAAPDAMVVVNRDGEIVLLNVQAEKQFGYSRDELVRQKVKNIIPEGFAERLIADALRSAEDALAQQIGTGIELIGRRKNGTDFPIEIMLSPLESAEGILVTAAIRDITTRKKAEANLLQKVKELNRSNEELGQFAYIASHDLQEPLRMVASYTQLLSRRYKGKLDSDADEFIAFAVDGASRMQRLIQDLLAYSHVGTKGADLLDTSSEEALQQTLVNLRGAIVDSGALVTHDSLPRVMADETQLIQLFQNLVGNAIKYQSSGAPQVHISASRNGKEKWTFSVQDNGLGIDAQYFDKIFGMFQRLHKRDEFAGTGIGLAICKKIVERHGGSISVESQPGQGSTFRFALVASERRS